MRDIVILDQDELARFVEWVEGWTSGRVPVLKVRATVDDGTWSPPMGRRDPECEAAYPEPTWLRDPTRCANGWHRTAPARMIQTCPECPTHPDVPAEARGYVPAQEEEGPTDWVQRLRPDAAPTAAFTNHPEPETQPGY